MIMAINNALDIRKFPNFYQLQNTSIRFSIRSIIERPVVLIMRHEART